MTGTPQQLAAISDANADCQGFNAVHVDVLVSGTNASATLKLQGSTHGGGSYQDLPDPQAIQTGLNVSKAFDVTVGASFVRAQLLSVSGTFQPGQGFSVIVTPYVSPGPTTPFAVAGRTGVPNMVGVGVTTAAPAINTVRAAYTVPTGKRTQVESIGFYLQRDGLPTTPGLAFIVCRYQPIATGAVIHVLRAQFNSGTINAFDRVYEPNFGYLNAGDYIDLLTSDASTNGTIEFGGAIKFTEYAA